MIVSQYAKSYETADGSEQQHGGSTVDVPLLMDHGRSDWRWEDDGGSAADPAPPTAATDQYTTKPTWCVESLRHLLDAVRASKLPATAAHEQGRADAKNARDVQAEADRGTESNRIKRDRFRNPWENS